MPTYYARSSGNVNGAIWATTPSGTAAAVTFAAGDVLVANSFTVTVNVSTDLGSTGQVRNDTTGGATAGGSFSLSNGVTLTASVFAGSAACVTLAGTASATVVGNVTGGTGGSNANGVTMSSTGTLTITGALTAGTGSNSAHALSVSAAGTVNVTGNVNGSTNATNAAINVSGAATISVTGNVSAGVGGYGININNICTVTVTGNVTGGATTSIHAIGCFVGAQALTVTGTVTGGSNSNSAGVVNSTTGTVSVVGTAVGAAGAAVSNTAGGTVTVTRAKGGALATSSVGVANSTAGGVTNVEEIEFGDLGASPTSGPIRLVDKTSNVAVMYRFGTTKKNLVDANASGLMPAASNVRSGVVYNGGNSTGTCAVPAAGSVALGVPVDDTTGTAALTPAAVWDYATSAATTSGSMGERLKDAATVASTGQQLANALTP